MPRLLILEDELSILKLIGYWLREYTLLQAATAEQALQLFIDCNRQVSLLVTDVRLGTSSGIQVALLLRTQIPNLPVILISGYPEAAWRGSDEADLERLGSTSVLILQKPLTAKALSASVCQLIGPTQALSANA